MPAAGVFSRYAILRDLFSSHHGDAEAWLGDSEREELSHWRHPQRRQAWLAARLLSKRLILEELLDIAPDPTEIQILSRSANGKGVRPKVLWRGHLQPWSLSISHTDQAALVALCTLPLFSVGVDLVKLESWSSGFLTSWFSPAERARVQRTRPGLALEIWGVKEVIYKACNSGEGFAPSSIEVRPGYRGRYVIAYDGPVLRNAQIFQSLDIRGHLAFLALLPPPAIARSHEDIDRSVGHRNVRRLA
jgi:phosphopantetheinyl transferase